jgi:hypothetical protein
MFSARVTSQVVNCSISLTAQVGVTSTVTIFSPTMLIARGGGAFVQTNNSTHININPLRRVFYAWRKYDLHNWLDCGRGNTLTGTGTNFTAAGSLIRVGCTLVTLANPVQVFQITAINSATQLTVTPAANPAIAAGTAYAILLSDSLSVDGLAQNIAETLTLYQKYERLRRRDERGG